MKLNQEKPILKTIKKRIRKNREFFRLYGTLISKEAEAFTQDRKFSFKNIL